MASPPSRPKLRSKHLSSALGRGALPKTENWESELRRMRRRAPRDRVTAVKLLTMFAALARDRDRAPAHPVLIRYVAQCVSAWAATGFDPDAATRCFSIAARTGRPATPGRDLEIAEAVEDLCEREGLTPSAASRKVAETGKYPMSQRQIQRLHAQHRLAIKVRRRVGRSGR